MTELSFVVTEFYVASTFYVAIGIILSRHRFFPFCFNLCRDRVKDCHDNFLHNFLQQCRDRKILCHEKISYLAIEFYMSFVATFSCWLRHNSFGLFEFCVATNINYVATQTAAFSTFLLLFYLFSLFFQITLAKHKVGEYSIIWYTNRSKIVKNMPKKWIKNR